MSILSNSHVWVWEEEPADRDFVELLEGEKINPSLQVSNLLFASYHQMFNLRFERSGYREEGKHYFLPQSQL
jgi:hypothetical protein